MCLHISACLWCEFDMTNWSLFYLFIYLLCRMFCFVMLSVAETVWLKMTIEKRFTRFLCSLNQDALRVWYVSPWFSGNTSGVSKCTMFCGLTVSKNMMTYPQIIRSQVQKVLFSQLYCTLVTQDASNTIIFYLLSCCPRSVLRSVALT